MWNWIILVVEQRLNAEGFRGYHKERALREPEKAGAIWKIFHPNDNMKIRAAIEEWKEMKVRLFRNFVSLILHTIQNSVFTWR